MLIWTKHNKLSGESIKDNHNFKFMKYQIHEINEISLPEYSFNFLFYIQLGKCAAKSFFVAHLNELIKF
jgi:hypothetical protein